MDVALLRAGTGAALLTFLRPLAVMSAEKADAPASPFPIDLVVESLQVGPRGTETIGSDEARVLPGRGASLDREFTLSGRTSRGGQATEKVRIQAEIRVNRVEPARPSSPRPGSPLPSAEPPRPPSAAMCRSLRGRRAANGSDRSGWKSSSLRGFSSDRSSACRSN